MSASDSLDCRSCGACCRNTRENVVEGFADYVEIERGDAILRKPDLMRRYAVVNDAGVPHLRLDPEGRCLALKGALGKRVRCAIYHERPSPCRRVQAGSELCVAYRAGIGI